MIKKIKSKLGVDESRTVFVGMLILLLGSGLGRIIGLISIPILARLYSPEHFGVLALYSAFVTVLAPMATLRYVQAIPLPKTDAMAFSLFTLCLKLIALSSLIMALVFYFLGETILNAVKMSALAPWCGLVVLGVSGTALYELFSLWATRKRYYKIIARTQFSQSFMGNLTKIILGILDVKPAGLIVGQFVSQSAGIFSFIRNFYQDYKALKRKRKQKKGERFMACYYRDFVWFRLPSQILMITSMQAPILIAAMLFDSAITGQLGLAMLALSLPISLIGTSMSKAYYAEIASIGRANSVRIRNITIEIQKKLFLVGIPVTVFMIFFAEPLFSLVFGEEWRLAGVFSAILAPYILLKFTSSSLDQVLNVLGKQSAFLIINSLRLAGFLLVYLLAKNLSLEAKSFIVLVSAYLCFYYCVMSGFVLYVVINKSCKF